MKNPGFGKYSIILQNCNAELRLLGGVFAHERWFDRCYYACMSKGVPTLDSIVNTLVKWVISFDGVDSNELYAS